MITILSNLEKRKFQFWHYKVSHGELLIRSPKSDKYPENIDILFFDVKYVELPRFLPDLKIEEASDEDVKYVDEKLQKETKTNDIVVLLSNGNRYLVVSSIMKIVENDLDLFELPFENLKY
ncbi:hypothetical protein [Paenibacillus sp. HW567]|uniref:hypothetical protein n=1 Tax=Paenibacillus sp. HW567 TaxID=1034769 RepID=UPI0003684A88|nr:hypothetical protein [Paenibacillus sp. HW567]